MYQVEHRTVSVKLVVRGEVSEAQVTAVRRLLSGINGRENVFVSAVIVESSRIGLTVFAELQPDTRVSEIEDAIIRELHATAPATV